MTPPESQSPSIAAAERQPTAAVDPLAGLVPAPVLEIIERLESRGIACWVHGDALLHALSGPARRARGDGPAAPLATMRLPTTVLCETEADSILSTLPTSIATAAQQSRLSLGVSGGALDLLPLGQRSVLETLPDFGFTAHSFAWRPALDQWADPVSGRAQFDAGLLDAIPVHNAISIFQSAPQRFWVAGRLLAEHALAPTDRLLETARDAFPSCLARLPRAAVARREIERVLTSANPEAGLRFWNKIGLTTALFPGLRAGNARRVHAVRGQLALRFAVWLDGASPGRSLRLLRMPHDRAAQITRLMQYHPIESSHPLTGGLQARVLRLRKRLTPSEVESLLEWRHVELDAAGPAAEQETARTRLAELEARLAEVETQREALSQIRALTIDGDRVMELLGCGPGREVGAALAYLRQFVAREPDANEPERLAAALGTWQASRSSDGQVD